MKLIDFHAHAYPEAIARRATLSICEFYDLKSEMTGTSAEKRRLDLENGIERTLLLPVAMSPKNADRVNGFVREAAAADPAFAVFGTVHPDLPDLIGYAEGLFAAGHMGIKLHPDMQRVDIDDPRLLPLYDRMQGEYPLYLHAGDPRHPYSRPERIARIMDLFPRLTVVAAHLGSWSMQDTALPLLARRENCIVDTSSAMSFMDPARAVRIIRAYGKDRVFFGTDYPVGDPAREAEAFGRLPLTDGEKEAIGHKNAEAFLRRYEKPLKRMNREGDGK